jgi:hypothetical protein
VKLKTTLTIPTVIVLSVLAGCGPTTKKEELSSEGKELLTVDFQDGQALQYKFVSSREPGKEASDKSIESMEMVVTYTPIEIDPYGLTTIKAICESVKVKRSKGPQKDAVEHLTGKTFTLTIGPTGKIEDYSQLDELIKEIGKKAFLPDTGRGRIKSPDMICDFVATQWFLWDSVSSVEKPSQGIGAGQSWKSKLSVPAPMVMRKARDVTYRLDETRQSEKGRLAVITSSYSPADSAPHSWPIPYSGRFQMAGTFGFLSGYKLLDLRGQGEELFNIDAGRVEQYNQQYQMQLKASMPLPLSDVDPMITIKQNLTMKLLE